MREGMVEMMIPHVIRLKRVYEPSEASDGFRVLADRLWPRGIRKDSLDLDEWAKDAAPTTGLRQAYHQGSGDFDWFRVQYLIELDNSPAAEALRQRCQENLLRRNVTLIYAAADTKQNHAQVLKEWLEKQR